MSYIEYLYKYNSWKKEVLKMTVWFLIGVLEIKMERY